MHTYLWKGTILITGADTGADTAARQADGRSKYRILIKNYVTFADCISKIHDTQVDNAKDLYVVMPIYNLIEFSENYSKTSGRL